MSARVYYAIGDVHGEAEMLAELLGHIDADAARLGVQPAIVFLGDLVDRGPIAARLSHAFWRSRRRGARSA